MHTPRFRARATLICCLLSAGCWLTAANAQTPGAPVTVADSEQPAPGPGQSPLLTPDKSTTWSRHPSPGTPRGWSYVLLADINRDGRDDLCGLYGLSNGQHVFGCVLNNGNRTFAGGILQVSAFNGPPDDSIHSTIRAVDLNGDGLLHLCGRTMEGVRCQRFNTTAARFDDPVLVLAAFSDASYWNQPQYYATIGFGRLSQTLVLCGRGVAGVYCYRKNGAVFGPAYYFQGEFRDANGWIWPQYFRTLRYVDVNRDGHSDICARGISGIVCAVWRPSPSPHFDGLQSWTGQFADGYGWQDARYYTSIRFGDINGDTVPEVCGRGGGGLYCGINQSAPGALGSLVGVSQLVQSEMSDAARWGNPSSFLESLLIVDFDRDGRNDVCGLVALSAQGNPQILCARSRSTFQGARFDPLVARVNNVIPAQKVVAGRIYDAFSASVGFCWNSTDGTVSCSVEWQ